MYMYKNVYLYLSIYIYICVCVCVCAILSVISSKKYKRQNNYTETQKYKNLIHAVAK